MWYVVIFFVGFATGCVFFKHRAKIKQAATAEANSLRNSAVEAIKPK